MKIVIMFCIVVLTLFCIVVLTLIVNLLKIEFMKLLIFNIKKNKEKRIMLNIRNVFKSSNEDLKKFLFNKIKNEISYFNSEAKKLYFFQSGKRKSLLKTQLEVILVLKQCKTEYYLLSKIGITLFRPKFGYKYPDDFYSGIEFCQFLLELQHNCNSQFPISLDLRDEEIDLLQEYDKGFKEFFHKNSWLYYISLVNKVINFFLEDHKNKRYISREEVWDLLTQLTNIKKDKLF